MRVAFVLSEFPSASETFVASQIAGLLQRGHDVTVYAERRGAAVSVPLEGRLCAYYPASFGVRLPDRWMSILRALRGLPSGAFRAWLRCLVFGRHAAVNVLRYRAAADVRPQEYDVIHAHFGPNGIQAAAMRAAGMIKGKLVVTFHGYDLSSYLREHGSDVYATLFEVADLVLPVTERWRRHLELLGCPSSKLRVHRMGVDCDRFRMQRRGTPARPTVITISRLVEKKGVTFAVRAVASVIDQVPLRYIIAGDGPEREKIADLIGSLGLAGHVDMVGWQDRDGIRSLLYDADIALFPSVTAADGDEEGLPVALMEAMAAGLPILTTDHSGITELVRDGVDGFVVPERDVDALAGRLREIAADAALRDRMGSAARVRVCQHHCENRLNDELVGHYRDVMQLTGRSSASSSGES